MSSPRLNMVMRVNSHSSCCGAEAELPHFTVGIRFFMSRKSSQLVSLKSFNDGVFEAILNLA